MTLDSEFIVVDGQKIKAQGRTAIMARMVQTVLRRNSKFERAIGGFPMITEQTDTAGQSHGEDGKDADSIKITQDENNVYFELADGTVITISKTGQSSNFITFEDINVKLVCLKNWDTNGDGELSYEEAAAVTSIGTLFKENTAIISFKELEYFTSLTAIDDNAFYHCDNLVSNVIPKM